MRNMRLVVILATVFVTLSIVSFAQDSDQTKGPMMGGGMMMGAGLGDGMGAMRTMMGMMNNLVATSDGGVVVMIGNKLYKYDKNLKLVKEAEIKVDMKSMQRMMGQFGKPGNTKGKTPNQSTPEDSSDHETHHPQ